MTKRKDTSFHIDVTPDDLISALNRIEGCKCSIDGTKIKMERTIQKSIWIFKKEPTVMNFSIPYRGRTRTIGASTLRDALSHLDLLDQFPDYQSLFEGVDPRYMLIQQFEGPLRRLKDK